jgi:hypothetical protein
MIFDYMDAATKVFLVRMIRVWLGDPENMRALGNMDSVTNIEGKPLSLMSEDEHVANVLQLLGLGVMRYIIGKSSGVGDDHWTFKLAMKTAVNLPPWIYSDQGWANLKTHIDVMMDMEQATSGQPMTPLMPSLNVIRHRQKVILPPQPPNMDPDREREIVRQRRQEAKT